MKFKLIIDSLKENIRTVLSLVALGIVGLFSMYMGIFEDWGTDGIILGLVFLLWPLPTFAVLWIVVWIKFFIDEYPYNVYGWINDRRFDWLMKHKAELPLSDEEKAMLVERNKNFISIDGDYFRSLKRYYKHNKHK